MTLEGKILKLDSTNSDYKNYILKINKIDNNLIKEDISLLVKTGKKLNLNPGDLINFKSKIYEIKNTGNFDYRTYLKLKNIYGMVYMYNFDVIGKNSTNYENFIEKIRNKILITIKEIYPKDSSNLLSGILIGERNDLSLELKNNFNRSGLTHIIAVSGFNITIIIIFLSFILRPFPMAIKIPIIVGFIVVFVNIVGDNSPAIRAAIMGIISYISLSYSRKINLFNLILFIVIFFIILNPLIINYDISFQLSLLSVIGIVYFSDYLKKLLNLLPNKFSIKEALILTLCSVIFTLPIIVVNFGQLSIMSPISNILVTFAIPLSMLFGFLSIVLYFITPILGITIGFIGWAFLKYILIITNFFGSLQYATISINFDEYKYIFEIIYYIVLVFIVVYFRVGKKKDEELEKIQK
ncbi:ComEC family competence protein [Candidatus Gracilibacteria bacterium]|nr:ComEC family competence protein [Candidatus Gracilibacteria bacterium]